MPIKSSETRPQQGRGQTVKTKCPCCRTYVQALYMKIDGKLVSVGEECPNCLEEKRKNDFNKEELEAISEAMKYIRGCIVQDKYRILDSICEKSERQLKYE